MAIFAGMAAPSEILDRLGGYRSVAAALSLPGSVVHKWRKRGIPARYWADVADLAKRQGAKDITLEAIRRPLWERAPTEGRAA